jgi:hypothetical protein
MRMKVDVTDPGLCPTVSFGISGFEQLVQLSQFKTLIPSLNCAFPGLRQVFDSNKKNEPPLFATVFVLYSHYCDSLVWFVFLIDSKRNRMHQTRIKIGI